MVDFRGPKAGMRGGPRANRPINRHDVEIEYVPSPRQKRHVQIHAADEVGILEQARLVMQDIDPGAQILRVRAYGGRNRALVVDKEF